MMRVLVWKEYREGRLNWLALAILGVASVFVVPAFVALFDPADPAAELTATLIALCILAVAYGVVVGSMLLTGEEEAGTLPFLDNLSARRSDVWWAKVQSGTLLVLSQGLLLSLCAWLADRKSTRLNSSHLGISYAVF